MWAVRVGVRESCHALRLVGLVFLDTKASCDSSKAIRRCHDALNSKPKVFRAEQTTDSYSWEALSTRPCSVRSALYVYVGCLLERRCDCSHNPSYRFVVITMEPSYYYGTQEEREEGFGENGVHDR